MNRRVKIISASLAYVPLVIAAVQLFGILRIKALEVAISIFYIPALSLTRLVQMYGHHGIILPMLTLSLMALWSSLIAVMFWKIASACLAEDEPDGKFDWPGFQARFFFGAIVGALGGWKIWIRSYQGKGDGLEVWMSLSKFMVAGAIIGGIAIGLGWREDF